MATPLISFKKPQQLNKPTKRGTLGLKTCFLFFSVLATLTYTLSRLPLTAVGKAEGLGHFGGAAEEERGSSGRFLKGGVVPQALMNTPRFWRRSLLQSKGNLADQELMEASRNGDLEKVIDLIENNFASLEYQAQDTGTTPIIEAAYGGHADVVKELIRYGADVNFATDDKGVTALWIAAYEGHLDVVKLLLSEVKDIDQNDKNGTTPLYIAALRGHLQVVQLLIDGEADIDAPSTSGATPLTAAVHNEHFEIVKKLLESGADPNVQKKLSGQSILWTAVYLRSAEAVKLLIEYDVDMNKPANDNTTPLYISMVRECLACAEALLDAGVGPDDDTSLNNWSPLHAAAAMGFAQGVQLLLERGANKDVYDHLTRRPLDVIGRTKPLNPAAIARLEDLLAPDEENPELRTMDVIDATSNSNVNEVRLSNVETPDVDLSKSSSGSSSKLTLWAILLLAGLGGLVAIQAVFILFTRKQSQSDWSRDSQQSPWRLPSHTRISTQRYEPTSPVTVASPPAFRTASLDSGKHPFSPTQNVPPAPESPETRRPAAHPVLESLPSDVDDSTSRGFERPVDMDSVQQMYTTRESQYDGYGNYTSMQRKQNMF